MWNFQPVGYVVDMPRQQRCPKTEPWGPYGCTLKILLLLLWKRCASDSVLSTCSPQRPVWKPSFSDHGARGSRDQKTLWGLGSKFSLFSLYPSYLPHRPGCWSGWSTHEILCQNHVDLQPLARLLIGARRAYSPGPFRMFLEGAARPIGLQSARPHLCALMTSDANWPPEVALQLAKRMISPRPPLAALTSRQVLPLSTYHFLSRCLNFLSLLRVRYLYRGSSITQRLFQSFSVNCSEKILPATA